MNIEHWTLTTSGIERWRARFSLAFLFHLFGIILPSLFIGSYIAIAICEFANFLHNNWVSFVVVNVMLSACLINAILLNRLNSFHTFSLKHCYISFVAAECEQRMYDVFTYTHTHSHISNQWLISTDLFWQFPNQSRHTFSCPNYHAPDFIPIHFKYRCSFGLICFSRLFLCVCVPSFRHRFNIKLLGHFPILRFDRHSFLFSVTNLTIHWMVFSIQHVMMLGFAVRRIGCCYWRIKLLVYDILSVALLQSDWADLQVTNAPMISKFFVVTCDIQNKTKTK